MLIEIHGMAGAGKSTLVKALAERHQATYVTTLIADHSATDQAVWLRNDELKYRAALRSTTSGQLCLMERGVASTYGYRVAHDALFGSSYRRPFLEWWAVHRERFIAPAIVVYLRVSFITSVYRRALAPGSDLWADSDFLARMEQATEEFLTNEYSDRFVSIDAEQPAASVVRDVLRLLGSAVVIPSETARDGRGTC